MKFKLLLATCFLCAMHGTALAEDAPSLSVTAEADYVSAYYFRGDRLSASAIEPSVNAQYGAAYAAIWSNQAFESGQCDEVDYTCGYTIAASNLDLGLTAYTYEQLNSFTGSHRSTWEPYAGYTKEVPWNINASVYGYYDLTLRVFTAEAKFVRKFELHKDLAASPTATLGYSAGNAVHGYLYCLVGVSFELKLTDKCAIESSESYGTASSNEHTRNQWVSLVGLKCSF